MIIKVGDYIRILNKVRPGHFSINMEYLLDGKTSARVIGVSADGEYIHIERAGGYWSLITSECNIVVVPDKITGVRKVKGAL